MTRRTKKKLMKRKGYKKYSNYRFYKVVEKCHTIEYVNMIMITTGRKANNKCIHSVKLFKNAYPVSINSGGGVKYDNNSTLSFESRPISNDMIEQKAKELIKNVNRKELG